jgi:hypothetical protein
VEVPTMSIVDDAPGWWTPDDTDWDAPGCGARCRCELCQWADQQERLLAARDQAPTLTCVACQQETPAATAHSGHCPACIWSLEEYTEQQAQEHAEELAEERGLCCLCGEPAPEGLHEECVAREDADRRARRQDDNGRWL